MVGQHPLVQHLVIQQEIQHQLHSILHSMQHGNNLIKQLHLDFEIQ